MAVNWKNFTFNPAETAEQVEFNRLQATYGPGAAYFLVISNQQLRTDLERVWNVLGDPDTKMMYKRLINTSSGQGNPLGLSAKELKTFQKQERAYRMGQQP
jgi:hypothetical protein